MPIKLKLNVSKINKDRLFQGKNGKYLDLVLFDKPDTYGNDGFVKEDVSKQDRDNGIEGNIIGNWKNIGKKSEPPKQSQPSGGRGVEPDDSEEIPFAPNTF